MKKMLVPVAILAVLGQIAIIITITSATKGDPCKTRSKTSAHDTFCDKYYTCGPNNQSIPMDCPNGLVYLGTGRGLGSPLIGKCEYAFNVDCSGRPQRILLALSLPSLAQQAQSSKNQQVNPCDVKSKIVSDATYCDRYWECVNGQPELYDCPNGLAFAGRNRGVADGCDYPWRGNYCEGKQLANPPIATEHCDWLYGIFGHETSCTRYWTCWNGTATEQLCIGGLLFSEESHSCDWPENVPGCQKHPLCKDDPNGNVPLGKSCNRYWNCQGGYPRLQRCPAMLVFDKRSLRCVVPPTDECDIPSTTPPPPEEIEEDDRKQQQLQQQQQNRPNQARQQAQASNQNRQQQQQQRQLQQQRQQESTEARPNFSPSLDNQQTTPRNQVQSQQQKQQQPRQQ